MLVYIPSHKYLSVKNMQYKLKGLIIKSNANYYPSRWNKFTRKFTSNYFFNSFKDWKHFLLKFLMIQRNFFVLKLLCNHYLGSKTEGDLNINNKFLEKSKVPHTHLFKSPPEMEKMTGLFFSIPIFLHHNIAFFSLQARCLI